MPKRRSRSTETRGHVPPKSPVTFAEIRSFNQHRFDEAVGKSLSCSGRHSHLGWRTCSRGLHYQIRRPQGKLLRAVVGEAFDVAVDIRRSSPSFGQ